MRKKLPLGTKIQLLCSKCSYLGQLSPHISNLSRIKSTNKVKSQQYMIDLLQYSRVDFSYSMLYTKLLEKSKTHRYKNTEEYSRCNDISYEPSTPGLNKFDKRQFINLNGYKLHKHIYLH